MQLKKKLTFTMYVIKFYHHVNFIEIEFIEIKLFFKTFINKEKKIFVINKTFFLFFNTKNFNKNLIKDI